ncbi:hypothetical protein J6590_026494 [Homalodisca vitripennis]|nr:hypothetical protein J6590_026494 [Homalodisca vitripennis]
MNQLSIIGRFIRHTGITIILDTTVDSAVTLILLYCEVHLTTTAQCCRGCETKVANGVIKEIRAIVEKPSRQGHDPRPVPSGESRQGRPYRCRNCRPHSAAPAAATVPATGSHLCLVSRRINGPSDPWCLVTREWITTWSYMETQK